MIRSKKIILVKLKCGNDLIYAPVYVSEYDSLYCLICESVNYPVRDLVFNSVYGHTVDTSISDIIWDEIND